MKLIIDIIHFIEDHLDEDLTVKTVSLKSGYDSHHFQKMFAACVGCNLGTYLRRRRLTKAAHRLLKTEDRIIDIAFSSGFESQEAFTRSFKAMFFLTPKQYRDQQPFIGLRSQPEMSPDFVRHLDHKGIDMEPRFEIKPKMLLIGLGQRFERDKTEDIGKKIWPEFSRRLGEIKNKLGEDQNGIRSFGVCREIWIDGIIQDEFEYFAAVEVAPESTTPAGMELITMDEQKYAIFTHRTGLASLEHTNQYIWGTWLPQSGYELAVASDLEVYPSDFKAPDNEVPFEIWVPIRN